MANVIIDKANERFEHSFQSLAREYAGIRAGRAMQVYWIVYKLNTMELQLHLINWLQLLSQKHECYWFHLLISHH